MIFHRVSQHIANGETRIVGGHALFAASGNQPFLLLLAHHTGMVRPYRDFFRHKCLPRPMLKQRLEAFHTEAQLQVCKPLPLCSLEQPTVAPLTKREQERWRTISAALMCLLRDGGFVSFVTVVGREFLKFQMSVDLYYIHDSNNYCFALAGLSLHT